jgi:epoxyqueuosine reductase
MESPSDMPGIQRREALRARLRELGFDVVRFARVEGEAPGAEALRRWLAEGMQGEMAWLARNPERRGDPRQVVPGARTVIALGVNYFPGGEVAAGQGSRWARYAQYEDYHDTITPALAKAGLVVEELCGIQPEGHRYYADTGPVLERSWATRAGVGFTGKNAMLISRDFGNWLFLAAILTVAELPPDEPLAGGLPEGGPGQLCGHCTRCLDACPTKALRAPGVLDARLCISYLTIENKGAIPEELRPAIGKRIYGCDICAEVCPWNRFAQVSRSLLLKPRPEIAGLGLADVLVLDQVRFAELFRRTPIKRIKLAGLLRNACVVAGNLGDPVHLPRLRELCVHESALVREHAAWAVEQLVRTDQPSAG